MGFRSLALTALMAVACAHQGGVGSPADSEVVHLPGVDTSGLTGNERREWSNYVTTLLAPCVEQPVSVGECVRRSRPCWACIPAASFVAREVARGKARSQVETAYRLRFAPDQVHTIEIGDSPWKGSASAPVVVVEWADFECPFCQRTAPELDRLIQGHPGQIQVVFKHYPITHHPNAARAARAAVAAHRQGKFWAMHDLMFSHATDLDSPGLERLASQAGLDLERYQRDVDDPALADRIGLDVKQADALGLQGTPMIYVNGRYFDFEIFDVGEDLGPWVTLELELAHDRGRVAMPTPRASGGRDAGSLATGGSVALAPITPKASSSAPAGEGSIPATMADAGADTAAALPLHVPGGQ